MGDGLYGWWSVWAVVCMGGGLYHGWSVWAVCMGGLYGWSVWVVVCMGGGLYHGWSVWVVCMGGLYGWSLWVGRCVSVHRDARLQGRDGSDAGGRRPSRGRGRAEAGAEQAAPSPQRHEQHGWAADDDVGEAAAVRTRSVSTAFSRTPCVCVSFTVVWVATSGDQSGNYFLFILIKIPGFDAAKWKQRDTVASSVEAIQMWECDGPSW